MTLGLRPRKNAWIRDHLLEKHYSCWGYYDNCSIRSPVLTLTIRHAWNAVWIDQYFMPIYQRVWFVWNQLFVMWCICLHGFKILNAAIDSMNDHYIHTIIVYHVSFETTPRLGPHISHPPPVLSLCCIRRLLSNSIVSVSGEDARGGGVYDAALPAQNYILKKGEMLMKMFGGFDSIVSNWQMWQ